MNQLNPPNFPRDVSHLNGRPAPAVTLTASDGASVDLSTLPGKVIVFIQPGSSTAMKPVDGWVEAITKIPGAAGCTGQCNAFSAISTSHPDVQVFGLSGQTPEQLSAVVEKLGLPYRMLSDTNQEFLSALGIRQVNYQAPDGSGNQGYHPRITLVIENGTILKAIVPELTPEGASASADQILGELT